MTRSIFVLFLLSLWVSIGLRADDSGTGPNLLSGDFESGKTTYNPWAGVDDHGNLQVISGSQLAVDDSGSIGNQAFSPSIAVGDLNGDGLPDLVVADARGYFWFFPNSGKPNAPVFTHGEIMPLWLGAGEGEGDAVPLIQLLDYTGSGALSIIAGNYFGGLYGLHNLGSSTEPHFRMPTDRAKLAIPTHTKNLMWCNYLCPFLYDWTGTDRLDLVMGDGSYSANSIYLFKNMGSNGSPSFNENNQQKIIPGMGREHLTPQVVDWNNDGKPDIITGERVGYIDVYLNQAAQKGDAPVFGKDNPIHVTFGGADKVGLLPTVCPARFYQDNMFDLLLGSPDGHISVAKNAGKPGSPSFGAPALLKGVNQYPAIIESQFWKVDRYRPDGAPYELLECTNASVEQGFVPPPAPFKGKGALKFSIVQPRNHYFPEFYLPAELTRNIIYHTGVTLDVETRYKLHFLAKAVGNISNLNWHLEGTQQTNDNNKTWYSYTGNPMSCGAGWSQVEDDIRIPRTIEDVPAGSNEVGNFSFRIRFDGDGTLYLDDISLRRAN